MSQSVEERPTAAATGASATERFRADKAVVADTSPERVSALARDVLEAVHATIREHKVTYAEYDALKSWLTRVGADGEWPLFLDVFVEHVVEGCECGTRGQQGHDRRAVLRSGSTAVRR